MNSNSKISKATVSFNVAGKVQIDTKTATTLNPKQSALCSLLLAATSGKLKGAKNRYFPRQDDGRPARRAPERKSANGARDFQRNLERLHVSLKSVVNRGGNPLPTLARADSFMVGWVASQMLSECLYATTAEMVNSTAITTIIDNDDATVAEWRDMGGDFWEWVIDRLVVAVSKEWSGLNLTVWADGSEHVVNSYNDVHQLALGIAEHVTAEDKWEEEEDFSKDDNSNGGTSEAWD